MKSDGFEHGFYAALLIQTNVLGLSQEFEDFLAVEYLVNHEKHRRGLYSKSWKERYGSRMDLLNDQAGCKISDIVTSDLEACELALDRARDGVHIGSNTNPARWAQRIGYRGNRIVYRHRNYEGKAVGARSDECGDVGVIF